MNSINMPIRVSIKVTQAHNWICTMHIPLTFPLIIKKLFFQDFFHFVEHTHKSPSAHRLQTPTQLLLLTLLIYTSSHGSTFTITPTPPTPSSFPDHNNLCFLPSITSILAPCPLHLTYCKQHTIILSHFFTNFSLSTHTTCIPHPKAPIWPSVILLAMLALSRMRGCTSFLKLSSAAHPYLWANWHPQ